MHRKEAATAPTSVHTPSDVPLPADVLDVTVVLLEDGYASTAIGPLEVFHSAGMLWNWLNDEAQEPRFRVRAASIDGAPVSARYSLGLVPKYAIGDIAHTDIIILPASGWDVQERIACSTALLPWLRDWYSRGAYIAATCSGVAFLAECGLLDGKRATTHWALAETLRARYPDVIWTPEHFITEDARLLCSGGVYAALDLSLYLVEKFCGHDIALKCAKSLLLSMPRNRQCGYAVLPLSRPHSDAQIRRAEDHLLQHFDSEVSIERLAELVGMGARNFIRRFKAATGLVPGAYLQALRIAAAKDLLERGTASVQTIASRTGYEDLAFFRTLFKRHTGMTPAEYRSRFAPLSVERGELEGKIG